MNNKMKPFKYDVVELIECVRQRPCLWDKSLEIYKDRVERRTAWEQIFKELDGTYAVMTSEERRTTGELILNKWTNVRDTFIKTLRTKNGKPKKRYLLHDNLAFLMKLLPEDDRTASEGYFVKQEVHPQTSFSSEFNVDELQSEELEHSDGKAKDTDCQVSYKQKNTKHKSRRNETRKRSKKVEIEDDSNESDDEISDSRLMNNPRLMNEDEAFFASLLPSVVKYDEDERLQFRIEVLAVMNRIKEKRKMGDD